MQLFARRLEEEIEEYKQHSPRPGSGFHGALRHPPDSSHTQHSVQETHANLKAGKETTQTMLVNNMGSPLIMSQKSDRGNCGGGLNLHLQTPSIYYPSDQGENVSLQIIAELYEPRKQHEILENFMLTVALGSNMTVSSASKAKTIYKKQYY